MQIKSYGLDERKEVHEVEFLALLAFIARERQRLRTSTNPRTKFTQSDLEMAYAFRQQFQGAAQAQRHGRHTESQFQPPQHVSPTHSLPPQFHGGAPPPNYQMPTSTSMQPVGRSPQRMGYSQVPQVMRSPTEASMQSHITMQSPINPNASMVASPQVPTFSPTSIRRPATDVNPLQFSPYRAMQLQGRGMGMENVHSSIQQPVGFQSHPAANYVDVPRLVGQRPPAPNRGGGGNPQDSEGWCSSVKREVCVWFLNLLILLKGHNSIIYDDLMACVCGASDPL